MIAVLFVLLFAAPVWAFPDTSVLDTFTGVDNTSPPNANWTNAEIVNGTDGCDLEDNAVAPSGTGGAWGCYWNASSFNANSEAYFTIANEGSTSFWWVCTRLVNIGTGTTDGYCVETTDSTDEIKIMRLDNNVATQIGSTATGPLVTIGDKLGIKAVGDQICSWFADDGGAWTQLGCATDATYGSGGNIGLSIIGTNTVGAADDFGGGNVAASTRRAAPMVFP